MEVWEKALTPSRQFPSISVLTIHDRKFVWNELEPGEGLVDAGAPVTQPQSV